MRVKRGVYILHFKSPFVSHYSDAFDCLRFFYIPLQFILLTFTKEHTCIIYTTVHSYSGRQQLCNVWGKTEHSIHEDKTTVEVFSFSSALWRLEKGGADKFNVEAHIGVLRAFRKTVCCMKLWHSFRESDGLLSNIQTHNTVTVTYY